MDSLKTHFFVFFALFVVNRFDFGLVSVGFAYDSVQVMPRLSVGLWLFNDFDGFTR